MPDGGSGRNYQDVGIRLSGITSVTFDVKAANDAHILLSHDPPEDVSANPSAYTKFIETAIGGWGDGKSVFRIESFSGGLPQSTNDLLHPTKFRKFWLSWSGNKLVFGKGGNVGSEPVLALPFSGDFDIRYMGVYNGFGSSGDWKIYLGEYTRQKKKRRRRKKKKLLNCSLLNFRFLNFEITRRSTGRQLHSPKGYTPIFLIFKLNKRGVSFFGERKISNLYGHFEPGV